MKLRLISLPSQARWLWAMPNLMLLMFVSALLCFLWILHANEQQERQDSLIEDVLWLEQAIRLQLQTNQYNLETFARQIAANEIDDAKFRANVRFTMTTNAEITGVAQLDVQGRIERQSPLESLDPTVLGSEGVIEKRQRTLRLALPDFSQVQIPNASSRESPYLIAFLPIMESGRVVGLLAVRYSLKNLLQNLVPWWIAKRYQISIHEPGGRLLATKVDLGLDKTTYTHSVIFDSFGYPLELRAESYKRGSGILTEGLPAALVGLSVLMVWSLWSLRRHMRERLEAEVRLKREMAWRRSMEDSLRSGMIAIDRSGRITYANRAFCELVGYSENELLGTNAQGHYWPDESVDDNEEAFRRVLEGGASGKGYSTRLRHRDGRRFDVRVYASPLIDTDGRHVGWVGSLYDITELKREREALQASQQRFVAVLNGLDAAVSVTQISSRQLLMCNHHFRAIFNVSEDDAPLCAVPITPYGIGDTTDAEVFDPRNQRWYHVHRRRSVWVDGSEVWMDIASDITEARQAADLERQQAERLQQTARLISMGEIASSLAHELNQPLSAIASYSTGGLNVLEHDQPSLPMLRQALTKISEQARRAGQIIRGIREFVQRREPHRGRCDFREMLETVLNLLSAELRKASVRLTVDQPNETVTVMADRVMVEQVLFNLVKNAIEAMSEIPARGRRITINCDLIEDKLTVRIQDSGSGISEAELARLFMPFYTTKAEGMGMGLNICRSIIESHRGHLWAEPNPNGACFCFTLPAIREKELTHAE
ncbi:PAS domain-containing sensor histidine kinase [Chitinivorax sp. B]|uniref:PAS domain-containing sensor histidine kinase n=1 Tax=Chitinivorax sp. B TaxID=2502235 RepID=UPI001484E064|nr:PAS domain-containing sensor histidine kinase [Chitinivorax sp. B]